MGLLKRESSKHQDESVFGRHGKAQVSYSLETDKQDKEAHHLIDSLPLLISDAPETPYAPNLTPSKKKKKRNSMKMGEILKSPQRRGLNISSPPMGGGSSKFSLTPLSGSKKKVSFRKLFCSSSNGNKTRQSNQYRLECGEVIPKLALSGDTTDYQSDNEGKLGSLSDFTANEHFQDASRKFNLDNSADVGTNKFSLFDTFDTLSGAQGLDTSSETNSTLFRAMENKSSNKCESSDSLEELLATKSSYDWKEDEHQAHRQQQHDLIKFLSETTPIKSSNEDNCKEDTVNVVHELMSLENIAPQIDDSQKDVFNVLNELISLENSHFTSVEKGKGAVNKNDPENCTIRNIVSKTIQERCNNSLDMNDCSWEERIDGCDENYSINSISASFDEDSTVVTVKWSNRSNNDEKNPTTPKVYEGPTISRRPKERSATSSASSTKVRKKKYQQAIKIYEDAMNLNIADFKNIQAYHSTMSVTATKLANLYKAVGQIDMAKKYVDASKKHRLCLINPNIGGSSSSEGSSFSSSSSSSSSSCEVMPDP